LVVPWDWARYVPSRPARNAIFDELHTPAPVAEVAALARELRSAPDPRARLTELVHGVVGVVLGLPAGKRLDARQGFFDAGLDSLMAVDVRNRLQDALGVELSATVAFDHPNVDQLVDHVLEALGVTGVVAP